MRKTNCLLRGFIVFFFQAEDGIRDIGVTGVQTCALPISARLDDLQSAITELSAVAASAAVHEGWARPTPVERDGERMWVIERPPGARQLEIGRASCRERV